MTPYPRSTAEFLKRHDIVAEEALYNESPIEKYRGNPLIAALMHPEPWEHMAEGFRNNPPFDPAIRSAPADIRLLCVPDILHFFYPRLIHRELYRIVMSLIYEGYLTRNPIAPRYHQTMRERLAAIKAGLPTLPIWEIIEMALVNLGLPGMGKTTGMNKVNFIFPDLIFHHVYRDLHGVEHLLEFSQIPRLRVKCPEHCTTLKLLVEIIRAFDRITYGGYEALYIKRNSTKEHLIPIVAMLTQRHHVGYFDFDELQNINVAGSGGYQESLNFLIRFMSEVKTPIVLTGTDRVRPLLAGALQQIRRGQTFGELRWRRLENDGEWENLMRALWKYQYVQKPIEEFDKHISNTIYEESTGILDYAVKLFLLAQIRAIMIGTERLSHHAIRETVNDYLPSARSILKAIRERNDEELAEMGIYDLPPLSLEKAVQDAVSKVREQPTRSTGASTTDQSADQSSATSNPPRRPPRPRSQSHIGDRATSNARSKTGGTPQGAQSEETVEQGRASGISPISAMTNSGLIVPIDED